MKHFLAAFTALFITVAASVLATAQEPAKKTIWDASLYTQEQAARGASTFAASCSNCHGANLQGNNAKALTGDQFFRDFQQRTVEYLFNFVSKNMPNNAPGTLDPTAYLDLTAFILSKNDVPAGAAPLKTAGSAHFSRRSSRAVVSSTENLLSCVTVASEPAAAPNSAL